MRSLNRATLAAGGFILFFACFVLPLGAQTAGAPTPAKNEKTVEEAYLQESLENMVIVEQSKAESKDMKLVALQYIKQAMDGGRKNIEIQNSLAFLATEGTFTIIRTGGYGKPTNNFPDIRAKACDYLGEFQTVEAKDTLIRVTLADNEPMVLSAAIRSLGKIGMNDNDEVVQVICYIVNRFDILMPDNSLAFESLVAIERLADKNGGIKDPAVIKSVMRIASGNYIKPVKDKANDLLSKLRKYASTNQATVAIPGGNPTGPSANP